MDKRQESGHVSPYLERPLRTYEEALADRERRRAAMQPKPAAAETVIPLRRPEQTGNRQAKRRRIAGAAPQRGAA